MTGQIVVADELWMVMTRWKGSATAAPDHNRPQLTQSAAATCLLASIPVVPPNHAPSMRRGGETLLDGGMHVKPLARTVVPTNTSPRHDSVYPWPPSTIW